MTSKFEVGRTYYTRSVCDHNCIISVTIASRTAKMVTTTEGKRFRTNSDYDGNEMIKPWGTFSMCPVLSAADSAELKPDWER